MLFENVAKAILKIECGEERGSDFHFFSIIQSLIKDIVVY
jgi:hypothetical protein